MIYYATQQTLEQYKLSTSENFQSEMGDIVRMIANKYINLAEEVEKIIKEKFV